MLLNHCEPWELRLTGLPLWKNLFLMNADESRYLNGKRDKVEHEGKKRCDIRLSQALIMLVQLVGRRG